METNTREYHGIKLASTIRGDRYSFDIYLANGAKKPDLKRSFLRVMDISFLDNSISLEDKTDWSLYAESDVMDKLKDYDVIKVKCIVSFQVFWNGEQIAVARPYKESKGRQSISDTKDRILHSFDRDGNCINCGFDGTEWYHWKNNTYEGQSSDLKMPDCNQQYRK